MREVLLGNANGDTYTIIEGLQNNLKLETLDIAVNKVTCLENLEHLKLRELWMNWNYLEDSDQNKEYLTTFKNL